MDNFSAGQAYDASFDHGAMLRRATALDLLHADDNLGDEAPFHSTWQDLDGADTPND